MLGLNKKKVALAFENWQIPKQDRSGFETLPLPKWNQDLGVWANAVNILKEAQTVGATMDKLETRETTASLSTSALEETK